MTIPRCLNLALLILFFSLTTVYSTGQVISLQTTGDSNTGFKEEKNYDLVILNGRVIDPGSNLDAIRNIGISKGKIKTISNKILQGIRVIDAKNLVIAPGFIDLNTYGLPQDNDHFRVMDGVTSALDLEGGTVDIDLWYSARANKSLINYGVGIGHEPVRMLVMNAPVKLSAFGEYINSATGDAANKAASVAELAEIRRHIEQGLKRGAVAVSFGIEYTPGASPWEILEMFRLAAQFSASCHVHVRTIENYYFLETEEVIAASVLTGAPVHIKHINSICGPDVPECLQIINEALTGKVKVTTDAYPYTIGMTNIESALFDNWEKQPDDYFKRLQWAETGDQITKQNISGFRKKGGWVAIYPGNPELAERSVSFAIAHPLTMIASDGILKDGKGHPRSSGTFSRVLGRYVRETKTLSLMEAIRKMTLMPAQQLEARVPDMKNKGRICVGADADITIFDPNTIIDRSTFLQPATMSEGVRFVLVGGILVVKDGQLQTGLFPGQPVRALVQ